MSDVYELLEGLRTVMQDDKYATRMGELQALEKSSNDKLSDAQRLHDEAVDLHANAMAAETNMAALHNEVKQKLEPQLKTAADASRVNQELLTQLNQRETAVAQREREHEQNSTRKNRELEDYSVALASRHTALAKREAELADKAAKLAKREASLKVALDA